MEKTLVAVFDNQNDARQALDALIDAGFSSTQARLTSTEGSGAATAARGAERAGKEESLGDKIASFFGFGDDDEIYTEAVKRGSCVLTVTAGSDDECERAEEIIEDFDPVDMDEREAEWREGGWQATSRKEELEPMQGGRGDSSMREVDDQRDEGRSASRGRYVRTIPVTGRPAEETQFGGQRTEMGESRYNGPERRMNSDPSYRGLERRAG